MYFIYICIYLKCNSSIETIFMRTDVLGRAHINSSAHSPNVVVIKIK